MLGPSISLAHPGSAYHADKNSQAGALDKHLLLTDTIMLVTVQHGQRVGNADPGTTACRAWRLF